MRRFTVSLPDDLYAALRSRGDNATPPASLQQMVRFAVDRLLSAAEASSTEPEDEPASAETDSRTAQQTDLLVFTVREVVYGIPIELVETVAAGLGIHQVPTSTATLLGVALFRESLTEVHDGGAILQGRDLTGDEPASLLAIPGTDGRVLMTVSSVVGLTPADAIHWSDPPRSSPDWVTSLAWNDGEVIAVIDPTGFDI